MLTWLAHSAFGEEALATNAPSRVLPSSKPAASEVLKDPDRAEPLLLMATAGELFEQGQKDRAVFWLYAGQLRAKYQLTGENRQLISIVLMTAGNKINAYAMRDVARMVETLDEVAQWDTKSFEIWATANRLNPSDPSLLKRRAEERNGLARFAAELSSNREEYEKRAQNYKDPDHMTEEDHDGELQRIRREGQERIRKNLSKEPLVRKIGAHTLTIPASYVPQTRDNFSFPNSLRITYFLPDFDGWTAKRVDEWVNEKGQFVEFKEHAMADIRLNASASHERDIRLVLAAVLPTVKLFGMDAYVNDFRRTNKQLPVNYSELTSAVHYIFVGNESKVERLYMICWARDPKLTHIPLCQIFVANDQTGFLISTYINETYAGDWIKIGNSLNSLINSWLDNNG
jgi:hypothetical protein